MVSSAVSCLGGFLAAFRRKEISEELAGRWLLERWLLGGKLNTSFCMRNVAWWTASKKKGDVVAKGNLLKPNPFAWRHVSANFWATLTSAPGSSPTGCQEPREVIWARWSLSPRVLTSCWDEARPSLHSPTRGQSLAWTLETLGDSEQIGALCSLATLSPNE